MTSTPAPPRRPEHARQTRSGDRRRQRHRSSDRLRPRATGCRPAVDGSRAAGGDCRARYGARRRVRRPATGDLTDDAFLDSLFAGARLHAMAHCAAILEGRDWRNDTARGGSGSIGSWTSMSACRWRSPCAPSTTWRAHGGGHVALGRIGGGQDRRHLAQYATGLFRVEGRGARAGEMDLAAWRQSGRHGQRGRARPG